MRNVDLKNLTPKQRSAWQMRYTFGWRIEKIAIEMGIAKPTACQLLQRAHVRVGLPRNLRVRLIRTAGRRVLPRSLSAALDY